MDRVAGLPGGFWVWVALLSWALLSVDRSQGAPSLPLRWGVVLAVALLVGRTVWGTMGLPGGILASLCGVGASWMAESK